MESITVNVNGKNYLYPKGVSLLGVSKDFTEDFENEIIIGELNGMLTELSKNVFEDCSLKFYDNMSPIGNLVYQNGVIFMLIVAFKEVLNTNIIINHSIDKGIYFETKKKITESDLELVSNKMNELIKKNLPIEKTLVNRLEAIDYYKSLKEDDKVNILKYTTNTNINLYKLDGVYDYFFSYLPISTGYMKKFKLTYNDRNSFILTCPNIYSKTKKLSYNHHEKLFNEFKDYSDWTNKIGIRNISDINDKISKGNFNDIILLNETRQNNKLYKIAENISKNKNIKIVLISGPSSSGKTTTSRKLKLFLKSFGLSPVSISIDDYFIDRDFTPKKEDGTYDFESIKAVDTKLFNNNLSDLLNGKDVKLPTYNFILGKKEFINDSIKLASNEIIIIEGLHALNEELTKSISSDYKYKIYLAPLTVLNIDNHNRFKTTDNRLLRRIVRDNRTRGYSASDTLSSWRSVREGEEKYVFSFQDSADVVFNTSLSYELNVLKTYVEPLLYSVLETDENYKDAVRLLNLLKNILPLPSDNIPKDSIIREFIGNSYFSD